MGFPKYFEDDEWIKVSRHTYRPFKIAKTFIGNLDNVSNIFVYDDDNTTIKLTDRLAGYGEKETWETAEKGVVAKTFIDYAKQPVAAVAEKLATANLSAHAKQVFSMPLKMVFDDEGTKVGYTTNQANGIISLVDLFGKTKSEIKNEFAGFKRIDLVELSVILANLLMDLDKNGFELSELTLNDIIVDPAIYEVSILGEEHVRIKLKDETATAKTLANLVWQILMLGHEPYGTNGNFYYQPERDYSPVVRDTERYANIWKYMPMKIRQTFYKVFHLEQNVSLNEWVTLLGRYADHLAEIISVDGEEAPDNALFPEKKQEESAATAFIDTNDAVQTLAMGDHNAPTVQDDQTGILPFGLSAADYGVQIHNLSKFSGKTHFSDEELGRFAVIYNYLSRSNNLKTLPTHPWISLAPVAFEISSARVYRATLMILMLIKHEVITGRNFNLTIAGFEEIELSLAVETINYYLELFSEFLLNKQELKLALDDKTPIEITANESEDDLYLDTLDRPQVAREVWTIKTFARFKYELTADNRVYIDTILREISNYKHLNDGQFEILQGLLHRADNAIGILPTGSGKSLIFYLLSILHPAPVLIVSPTDILIEDQVNNLKQIHNIDAVSFIKNETQISVNYHFATNIVYVTPIVFQNPTFQRVVMKANKANELSYFVLDEVHTVSLQGHDFRPDYFMLVELLKSGTLLDNTVVLGLTATANYSVVTDVTELLEIENEQVLSPVAYDKYNFTHKFFEVASMEDMHQQVAAISHTEELAGRRIIIFTKSDAESKLIGNLVPNGTIYTQDAPDAYRLFATKKSNILITTGELGIGINLPLVETIIQAGLPASKNDYVQSIGRGGRAGEAVNSFVVYLKIAGNLPEMVLDVEESLDGVMSKFRKQNDYAMILDRLLSGFKSHDDWIAAIKNDVMNTYQSFDGSKGFYLDQYPKAQSRTKTVVAYLLYAMKFYQRWYIQQSNNAEETIIAAYEQDKGLVSEVAIRDEIERRVLQTAINFFMADTDPRIRRLGNAVQRAKSLDDVIEIFANWFFEKFVFTARRELINELQFVQTNKDADSVSIARQIAEYFTLPFLEIKETEQRYAKLSYDQIAAEIQKGIEPNEYVTLERLSVRTQNPKYEYFFWLLNLIEKQEYDAIGLQRILNSVDLKANDVPAVISGAGRAIGKLSFDNKYRMFKDLRRNTDYRKLPERYLLQSLYESGQKDDFYYAMIAKNLQIRI